MIISIIVATYNSAKTVRTTFDSILQQSFQNYEVLVQDGGSKDNTLDIVCEYESRFGGRLSWRSEKDKGLYDAMNRAFDRATGDIWGILNSDDFFTSSDILAQIAETFLSAERKGESLDAVYGDVHFVNSDNLQKCVRYYSSCHFSPWKFRFGYMPAHPSFYCRKEVYQKYGKFNLKYRLAADYEILVRFFRKGGIQTRYLPLDMVTMRTGGVSNRDIKSRMKLTQEDALACRDNGFYSNVFLCSFKYFTKIFEFI